VGFDESRAGKAAEAARDSPKPFGLMQVSLLLTLVIPSVIMFLGQGLQGAARKPYTRSAAP
jgi:hypothetical protein